jgi:hypothetical protein
MRRVTGLAVVVAAVLSSGCLVKVEKVRLADATAAFREARAEIARIQATPGPAHELSVLVYDPGDGEMVRVNLPLWLARKFEGQVNWDDELGGDDDGERIARHVRKHVRLQDLEKAGRGVLVEVEEHDGEQVLVWLR